jgi:hypothetical protein
VSHWHPARIFFLNYVLVDWYKWSEGLPSKRNILSSNPSTAKK